jgi:hypothetical protein
LCRRLICVYYILGQLANKAKILELLSRRYAQTYRLYAVLEDRVEQCYIQLCASEILSQQ